MPESRAADQWRPALVAGVGSVVLGVLVAAAAVGLTGATDSAVRTVRAGAHAWLVAVGASFRTDEVTIDVVPVGASVAASAVAALVARLALRTPIVDPVAFGAMAGGVAGVLAAILSAATSVGSDGTSFVRAAFGTFVVVGAASAYAAARRSDLPWAGLPQRWRPVAEGAATGVTGLLGGATLVALVLLAARLDRAADLWATLDPGGPFGLALLCLLGLPTLVLWTTSVLLGPGFDLGTDGSVDLSGSALGAVPGFPPLAALPDPGPFGGWVVVLSLIPLAAGLAAGAVTRLGTASPGPWSRVLGDGALSGAAAGTVVGLLLELSRGALGPGAMQHVGPPAGWGLLVAVPLLAAAAALGAAGAHYRSDRERSAS